MDQGNRTRGLLQSSIDTSARPVSDAEANEMIAVKPTDSLAPMIMIRKGDFDCARHYRLSQEEIDAIGKPKSLQYPN